MPRLTQACILAAVAVLCFPVLAEAEICQKFGPQTPRDIDSLHGENSVVFPMAPAHEKMNLCNIHFHKFAEHKGADFSLPAEGGEFGGFHCNATTELTEAEKTYEPGKVCKNIAAGDTIEVHWVHSTCPVAPGPGLGSCSSETCMNPTLRVETQVFLVVNDPDALDFADFAYEGTIANGFHQARAIPGDTGAPVKFTGSTTGPSYSESVCSPAQVTWSVRPRCARVNIASLGQWCEGNIFKEDHGHGVRPLVTSPALLSKIQ